MKRWGPATKAVAAPAVSLTAIMEQQKAEPQVIQIAQPKTLSYEEVLAKYGGKDREMTFVLFFDRIIFPHPIAFLSAFPSENSLTKE